MRRSRRGLPLVNVWATWCYSCRVEHPYLLSLAEQGIPIYGLNYKDDSAKARDWLEQLGDPYRLNIVDVEGSVGSGSGGLRGAGNLCAGRRGIHCPSSCRGAG